jgi:FkbM family methyltransferase
MDPKFLQQAQRLLAHPLLETFEFHEKAGRVEEGIFYLWDGTRFRSDWVGEDLAEYVAMVRGMGDPVETRAYLDVLAELSERAIVVLEAGAGGGRYSLHALRHHPDAQAVLVEAHPRHYELTCDHMVLNGVADRSRVVHAAVSAEEGRIVRFCDAGYGSSVHSSGDILVPTVTVTGIMRDLEIPYLHILHMDVQGAEVDVLRGAHQALRDFRIGYLFIGTHSEELQTECRSILIDLGYTLSINESPATSAIGGDGLIVAKAPAWPVDDASSRDWRSAKECLAALLRTVASRLETR